MEGESNPMKPKCRSGCGYYANPSTNGFCNVCYQDSLAQKQQQQASKTNDIDVSKDNIEITANVITGSGSSVVPQLDKEDKNLTEKKVKNRCASCRKKVGYTGFMCRCGGLYCSKHRYSNEHACSFNYRQLGAEEIRRNNPVVVGEKVRKI